MRTPRNGSTTSRTTQPALPQPPTASRRNRSEKMLISSQNQITQQKNTNIVHMTSSNGYPELAPTASTMTSSKGSRAGPVTPATHHERAPRGNPRRHPDRMICGLAVSFPGEYADEFRPPPRS